MHFFVGVTDNKWYEFLSELAPDEVNFWRPGGGSFRAIDVGAPFLFKLHSPLNFIVGGGYFIKSVRLPVSLAWEAFAKKNGAPSWEEFISLIKSHRGGNEPDPEIGCIILNQPFFFPREMWIPVPEDWSKNIVVGKTYNTDDVIGKRLWKRVSEYLTSCKSIGENIPVNEEQMRYGREYLQRSRLGQGAFRALVTGAYRRQCAITGEKTLPVLEAAHIKPFAINGPNQVNNGLLIRSDMHRLFDLGYITVTPNYHIEVSSKIRERFENGRHYYAFHGKKLIVIPESLDEQPSRDFLSWHNTEVYQG